MRRPTVVAVAGGSYIRFGNALQKNEDECVEVADRPHRRHSGERRCAGTVAPRATALPSTVCLRVLRSRLMGEKTAFCKSGLVCTSLAWEAFKASSDTRIRPPCFSQELIGLSFWVCRGSSGPACWAKVTPAVCVCGIRQGGRNA